MGNPRRPIAPTGTDDAKGAQRVFDDFIANYEPALTRLELHLDQIIKRTDANFSIAYRPWKKGLHDLLHGANLISRQIPLRDAESFLEALRMFTFEGAARFLHDLSLSCKLALPQGWADHFREHIKLLLLSYAILSLQQTREHDMLPAPVR